jgi:hypothetical protein
MSKRLSFAFAYPLFVDAALFINRKLSKRGFEKGKVRKIQQKNGILSRLEGN